jgi:hypothetical protein
MLFNYSTICKVKCWSIPPFFAKWRFFKNVYQHCFIFQLNMLVQVSFIVISFKELARSSISLNVVNLRCSSWQCYKVQFCGFNGNPVFLICVWRVNIPIEHPKNQLLPSFWRSPQSTNSTFWLDNSNGPLPTKLVTCILWIVCGKVADLLPKTYNTFNIAV